MLLVHIFGYSARATSDHAAAARRARREIRGAASSVQIPVIETAKL
jgi:hypothetical protein